MTGPACMAELTRLADSLERADPTTASDIIANAVIEAGGTYIPPSGTCTHLFEIGLHGITGTGASEPEAIRNWTRLARRMTAEAQITPTGRCA